MEVSIQPKSTSGLYDTPLLHQSVFWSAVKKKQGITCEAYDIKVRPQELGLSNQSAYLLDDLLILIQPITKESCLAYSPYGPFLTPSDEIAGPFLEELSEALRPHLPEECIALRWDLPWESPWALDADGFDENGQWKGPPQPELQELRLNWGTCEHNLRKASGDILPTDTLLVTLRHDEDDILASMKAKTRYNIRLAKRHGIVVKRGSFEDLDVFYTLYRQTCRRNRLNLHHRSYFETLFITGCDDFELLIAYLDRQTPLAALFITYSGDRATYLYGASSSDHRNKMAPYLLQWEAIKHAKENGCRQYDLFGTPPNKNPAHPMHGLYRFKSGFGGDELHRLGCWDYPFNHEEYEEYSKVELLARGYHLNWNSP